MQILLNICTVKVNRIIDIAMAEGKKDDVVSMLSSAFTSKMEILRNFEEKKHFEDYHFCVVDKLLRL
jgi:hypothetical protein